jgi:hypothetical protein
LKIILFGSCVTRDIFSGDFFNGKDNVTIDYSFSRISLISLNSLPLNIDVTGIELIGPHQRRALADDLNKTVYPFMAKRKGKDVLLIDFVDERFHLFKWKNHYITRSNEFINAKLSERIPGEIVNRFSPETTELWKESCLLFIKIIRQNFVPGRIILHRAFWMTEYIENNEIHRFLNQAEIEQQNGILTEYYDFFEKNCSGLKILDVNNRKFHADKNHQWGLGAMHYEQAYYDACMKHLQALEKEF